MFLCWTRQRMTSWVWAVTLHKRRWKSVKRCELTRPQTPEQKQTACRTSRPASWSLRLVSLTWPLKHNITFVRQIKAVVTAHPCDQIILHEESRTKRHKFRLNAQRELELLLGRQLLWPLMASDRPFQQILWQTSRIYLGFLNFACSSGSVKQFKSMTQLTSGPVWIPSMSSMCRSLYQEKRFLVIKPWASSSSSGAEYKRWRWVADEHRMWGTPDFPTSFYISLGHPFSGLWKMSFDREQRRAGDLGHAVLALLLSEYALRNATVVTGLARWPYFTGKRAKENWRVTQGHGRLVRALRFNITASA